MDQAPVMTPRNDYSTLVGVMREIEDFNRCYGCLDAVFRAQGVLVDDDPQPERVDSTNIADVRARKEALIESDVLSRVGLEIAPGVSRMTINSGNETENYETLGLRIKDGGKSQTFYELSKKTISTIGLATMPPVLSVYPWSILTSKTLTRIMLTICCMLKPYPMNLYV